MFLNGFIAESTWLANRRKEEDGIEEKKKASGREQDWYDQYILFSTPRHEKTTFLRWNIGDEIRLGSHKSTESKSLSLASQIDVRILQKAQILLLLESTVIN